MKKRTRSALSLVVALALVLGLAPAQLKASEEVQNQMSSTPQEVQVSHYKYGTSINFDDSWKFYLGEASGAHQPSFQDARWTDVNLPHDYSVEQAYSTSGEAESGYKLGGVGWYRKSFTLDTRYEGKRLYVNFDGAYMEATVWINGQQVAFHPYGYTPFTVDITDYVDLHGTNLLAVRTNNPVPSSRWYSGSGLYRSVTLLSSEQTHFEEYGIRVLTPNLQTEAGGTVQVQVNTKFQNEGEASATLKVKTSLYTADLNYQAASLVAESAFSPEQTLAQGEKSEQSLTLAVQNPTLWSVETPHLYILRTELYKGEEVVDRQEFEYGFRYTNFDRETGFSLNGNKMKLQGVCMHHDQGALGAAGYYDAMARQVKILKEMGTNSIRVTHNPASSYLIQIANREGVLLIDEAFDTWLAAKNGNGNDYARWFRQAVGDQPKLLHTTSELTWAEYDLKQMVRRAVNAPSVIMWSMGNEVMEGFTNSVINTYPQVVGQLATWADEVDGTRPITIGDNKLKARWSQAIGMGNTLSNKSGLQGIVGYNYADSSAYRSGYNSNQNWIIYGSETASSVNSRGVYNVKNSTERSDKQLTSYDQSKVPWGHFASQAWYDVITNDFVAGEYVWTGFDYLGEPTPWNNIGRGPTRGWPSPKSSYFGIIDTAGFPKDSYYFYQSQWNPDVTTLHMLPQWKDGQVVKNGRNEVEVVVYSDAASVDLLFTGADGQERSLGRKEFTKKTTTAGYSYQYHERERHDRLYLTWWVPYEDGTLRAVAYNEAGEVIQETVGQKSVSTYDEAHALRASVNRTMADAKHHSLAYIEVDVVDEAGRFVANADNRVQFTVSGPAKLLGLDNGSAADHQSYLDSDRKAFSGKVLAIVGMTGEPGEVVVTASSEGLQSASVSWQTKAVETPKFDEIKSYLHSKNIYIRKGSELTLPEQVSVTYKDGRQAESRVRWIYTDEHRAKLNELGAFVINGSLEEGNIPISVNIVVIEDVVAMLNYSTATLVNTPVNLPPAREAVMADGTIMETLFPVEWEAVEASRYATEGQFVVNGTANVLGKTLPITASIRVAQATYSLGENVAKSAATLSQDIPVNLQSDTLEAVRDNSTRILPNNSGGDNPSAWSNYKAAQNGTTESTLTFDYDTAQNIGQVKIYFFTDSASARIPSKVELFYNFGAGTEDLPIEAEVTTSNVERNLYAHTFTFTPVPAVAFKVKVTNSTETLRNNRKACTGITEIQLMTYTSNLQKSTTAELDGLTVNGKALRQAQLDARRYNTEARKAVAEPSTEHNVASTILPAYDLKVKVLTESEDQSKRDLYVINLGEKEELQADDGSNDVPHEGVQISVGSEERRPGNYASGANDGNPNSFWHSSWRGASLSERWIKLELPEPTLVDALRYLPRPGYGDGNDNGRVKHYRVYGSTDDQAWTLLAEGDWANNPEWKLASFDATTVKYLKLEGVETYGSRPNAFMTAAEIRAHKVESKKDISAVEASLEKELYPYSGRDIEPGVTVRDGEKFLEEGLDYYLEYENNIEEGTATALVKGIVAYEGEKRLTFRIVDYKVTLSGESEQFAVSKLEGLEKVYELNIDQLAGTEPVAGELKALSEAQFQNVPKFVAYDLQLFDLTQGERIATTEARPSFAMTLKVDPAFAGIDNLKLYRYADGALNELVTSYDEETRTLSFQLSEVGSLLLIGEVDKTALATLLREAQAKLAESDRYSEASLANLQRQYQEAKASYDATSTTVLGVTQATAQLQQALDALLETAQDLSELEKLVRQASTVEGERYKPSTRRPFEEALAEARGVLNQVSPSKETVEAAYRSLKASYEALAPLADFTALREEFERVEALRFADFTPSSVRALEETLETARGVLSNLESEQADVNEATQRLQVARLALKKRANLEVLQAKLEALGSVDLKDKTEASRRAFEKLVAEVQAFLNAGDLFERSQEEVDAQVAKLALALSKLETKPSPTPTPSPVAKPSVTPSPTVPAVKPTFVPVAPVETPQVEANNNLVGKDEEDRAEQARQNAQNNQGRKPAATALTPSPTPLPQDKTIQLKVQDKTTPTPEVKSDVQADGAVDPMLVSAQAEEGSRFPWFYIVPIALLTLSLIGLLIFLLKRRRR